jgi:hypothetical protein
MMVLASAMALASRALDRAPFQDGRPPGRAVGRQGVQRDAIRVQRFARGHALALDVVAQDIDGGPEGDLGLGHGGTLLRFVYVIKDIITYTKVREEVCCVKCAVCILYVNCV